MVSNISRVSKWPDSLGRVGGLAHILPLGPEHVFWLPEVLASGASWLCPNHHYSWNNVYFQPSLPLLLLVWNDISISHASRNVICPERRCKCLLSLQGGMLFCSVPRALGWVCVWQRQFMLSPRGYPTTLLHFLMFRQVPLILPPEVCSELTPADIQHKSTWFGVA